MRKRVVDLLNIPYIYTVLSCQIMFFEVVPVYVHYAHVTFLVSVKPLQKKYITHKSVKIQCKDQKMNVFPVWVTNFALTFLYFNWIFLIKLRPKWHSWNQRKVFSRIWKELIRNILLFHFNMSLGVFYW